MSDPNSYHIVITTNEYGLEVAQLHEGPEVCAGDAGAAITLSNVSAETAGMYFGADGGDVSAYLEYGVSAFTEAK